MPDGRAQFVTMDFTGPLKEDLAYNCILSMTDHMGADIHIVPT